MTTRQTAAAQKPVAKQFPERIPRQEMQNSVYLDLPGYQTGLYLHLGGEDTTLVISEAALGWNLSQGEGIFYPDLMIAFNIDREAVIAAQGISIDDVGKPPEFVMEIASKRTARNDYGRKREGYARYGVPEYWRFDPTGQERYPEPLAGDRLVGNEYQPIAIEQTGDGLYRGHSDVLNLDVCWEHGQLRWYDPVARAYIMTHNDERAGRIAAEAEAAEAQARIRELEEELHRRSQ